MAGPNHDYWVREGHMWKRVLNVPRIEFYIPQQEDHGPDVTKLLPRRNTMIKTTNEHRGCRIEDDWTKEGNKQFSRQWTSSTNFEEDVTYKYDYIEDDTTETTQAARAKAAFAHLGFFDFGLFSLLAF